MDLIAEQKSTYHISIQDKYTHFQKMVIILSFKYIYAMGNAQNYSKYHPVLRIYTSGIRKRRTNIYMANYYFLLSRFHLTCLLVCFIVDFDYL